ncbi:MAG TPA: hypothetical protein VGB77_09710 [Abditibacteriaceae bacterium]|jgi:hypothetical protein
MNTFNTSSVPFSCKEKTNQTISTRSKDKSSVDSSGEEVWMLLTQAGICCEEARHAAGRRRYRAACGLFSTAIVLYKMLLREGGTVHDPELRRQIEEQIQHITSEREVHSNLCSQWRSR